MGKNVTLKPTKKSQKFHFPSRSSSRRPVIFGEPIIEAAQERKEGAPD
jgi:hypothetical protein